MSADSFATTLHASPKYRFPPGPRRNVLWRLLRLRSVDPIGLFQRLARQFGDAAHYKVGLRHVIFLNHPDYIREVLVVQNEKFIKERTVQRSKLLLGEGMITSEGTLHRQQRQLAQPAFHRQRIPAYAETMVEYARRARESWQHGATLNIALEMMHLTLGIVARTLFDTELGQQVRELAAAINRIMGLYNLMIVMPAAEKLVHLPLPGILAFRRARRRIDAVVERMIQEHRAGRRDPHDLLSIMLRGQQAGGRDPATQLRDEVVTFFLAGYETVSNALTWTWYLLSQHPEVERKLHQELDSSLGGRLPTCDDYGRLRYVEMVLAESMRLFPPAWGMGRIALQDFTVGPYHLPAGTTVAFSQYIVHRDPRWFPNPLRFDPERFTPSAKAARPKLAYFPFGAGGRQCIGEAFAWMEGVLVLATLAQKWKLTFAGQGPVQPEPLITLRPKNGMPMRAELRDGKAAPDAANRARHSACQAAETI